MLILDYCSLMKGNVSGEAKLKQTLAKYNCELKAPLIKAISNCESWIITVKDPMKWLDEQFPVLKYFLLKQKVHPFFIYYPIAKGLWL